MLPCASSSTLGQMKHKVPAIQERDVVSLPLRAKSTPRAAAVPARFQVLKRFDFEPRLMRSGVIAAQHNGTALLYVKGAPGMIKPLLREEPLPPDFQQVRLLLCFKASCHKTQPFVSSTTVSKGANGQ